MTCVVQKGFDEEYPLEDMEVAASDFMAKVPVSDFRGAWEQLGDAAEVKGSFGLKYKTLVEAVAAVIENLGMQPCDNTSIPRPDANAHVILLSGVFVGNLKALVKCRVALNADTSTTNQIILQARDIDHRPDAIRTDCLLFIDSCSFAITRSQSNCHGLHQINSQCIFV